jgi:hypothetical protein
VEPSTPPPHAREQVTAQPAALIASELPQAWQRSLDDLDNLGRDFLDRYVVITTSGSTGVPALLVEDRRTYGVNRLDQEPIAVEVQT